MDVLGSLVAVLTKKEVDDLVHLLKTNKSTSNKEAELLKLLRRCPDAKPHEVSRHIYNTDDKKVAVRALRKRLTTKLIDYTASLRVEADANSPDAMVGQVLAARWLIDRNQPKTAFALLTKAEEEARAARRYALLDNIYLILIDHAGELGIQAADVVNRWTVNRKHYDTYCRIKFAEAVVHDELEVVRQGDCPPEPETIVEPVLQSISITPEEAANPHLQLALVSIVRRAYASVKRYDVIAPFVERTYASLLQQGSFSSATTNVQTRFLYMQAHALYRTRNFVRCLEVLDAFYALIHRQTGKRHPLFGRAVLLEAALRCYTGENARAIELLEQTLNDGEALLDERDRINIRLNLAVYRFNAEEFRAARKYLSQTAMSDARTDKLMGKEWRFKRGMIELIVQYELGEADLALAMIRRLQEGFASYLVHPAYESAAAFLAFVKRLIVEPESVTTETFRAQIKATSMVVGPSRDDLQGQAFFAWLHSKMVGRSYYSLLVERLNAQVELGA